METGIGMFKGFPPVVKVGEGNPEATKYGKLWNMPEYRIHAPGENLSLYFLRQVRPKPGSHVIDFGCGTGRGALRIHESGTKVTMLDFARNCLDEKVKNRLSPDFVFKKHDLVNPSPVVGEYGFCTDVMEHIPPNQLNRVLENILRAAKHNFFAICTIEDVFGAKIGEKLHLSVHPYEWWLEKFQKSNCAIHWSEKIGSYAFFYVTAWEEAQILVDHGRLNTTHELIRSNVEHNCQQGYTQLVPHPTQDTEVMIVGSGPSLNQFEGAIRAKREDGVKMVTLNGAYNWALEKNIIPSATVVVDARESNGRFTKPPVDNCKYLLCSQCHPSVFEGLPKDQVFLWHTMSEVAADIVKEHCKVAWSVPGGSTVLLRAIPLLRMLGYYRFHIYGCDSCIVGNNHHAMPQPENDGQVVIPILVEGRLFHINPWMASQAREFQTLIQKMGDVIEMIVYGDGLLAHLLNTGAELDLQKEIAEAQELNP